jgi:cytochrome c oxidase cbb3-type subunit 3
MGTRTPQEHGHEIDPVSGVATTAHVWDGIQELNNPLPRWWLWLFIISIVWAFGYWVVYPAWPLGSSATQGVFGWHSREAVVRDLAALKTQRGAMAEKIAAASLDDIRNDPELLAFARAQGKAAFGDNCAPCHGQGGAGAKGYPNLNDDDWLWGGSLAEIQRTIVEGARFYPDKGHLGTMPAFGRDGTLKREEISQVADFVRVLAGLPAAAGFDQTKAAKLFADNCAVCHGEAAKGNKDVGAPNLTDGIWLYGPDKATIMDGIANGRGNVMPAWDQRLDEATIKALTVYVHALGGGN